MRARRWLPTAGVGLVLLACVLAATTAVVRSAANERDAQLASTSAVSGDRILATIDRNIVEVERLALLGMDSPAFRRHAQARVELSPELTTAALARVDGERLAILTAVPADVPPLVTGADLRAAEGLGPLLDRVLVEADATAGAPGKVGNRDTVIVGAPIVRDVDGSESALRSSVVGMVIGAVDVERIVRQSWNGPFELTAPNGASVGDAADGEVLDRVLVIRGRAWTLRLDEPPGEWPAAATAALVLGIPIALLVTAAFARQLQRRRAAEEQAAARSLQLERIAEAGSSLQQSLELGELLPSFCVALAADFGLRWVAVGLYDSEGSLLEAFATGEHAGDSTLELPLRRGFRSVGVLSVQANRPFEATELISLQALADLLAVAMSNAQLYEREQLNAARLRDLDALKNAFLGTVSHELRTSMTAIMGFGELLSDAWDNLDDERRREMAGRIRRSAGSLRHLVDDLLDFARLEQERLRVSPRPIDLAATVRSTVDGLTPLLTNHQLDLRVPETLTAWADPVAVERILANLLSNAAKYSPNGSIIAISASAVGDRARIEVADQGPGIPVEERHRVFARFYRLDTPETVRTRGAGIGLAILHDFAARSGAPVTIEDAPGGGARFVVDFPTTQTQTEMAVAT